jgi:hypothetical protein
MRSPGYLCMPRNLCYEAYTITVPFVYSSFSVSYGIRALSNESNRICLPELTVFFS